MSYMHLSHFQASKFQRIWLTYPQAFSVEAVQGVPLDILLPNFELDFTFYNSFSANYWKVSPFVTAKKKRAGRFKSLGKFYQTVHFM